MLCVHVTGNERAYSLQNTCGQILKKNLGLEMTLADNKHALKIVGYHCMLLSAFFIYNLTLFNIYFLSICFQKFYY